MKFVTFNRSDREAEPGVIRENRIFSILDFGFSSLLELASSGQGVFLNCKIGLPISPLIGESILNRASHESDSEAIQNYLRGTELPRSCRRSKDADSKRPHYFFQVHDLDNRTGRGDYSSKEFYSTGL